jgi:energy-coupling factor transport system permease protein
MRLALAYSPGRSPLHRASAAATMALLAALAVPAFAVASPVVIGAAALSLALVGIAAGAGRAVGAALRAGLALAALMIAVNALVTHRGDTILVRGWELPAIGSTDVTLESLAAGGVIGLRVVAAMLAFAVFSSCVDPDAVLRLLRPVARRSALSAALTTRLVPVAMADLERLREAAALRGPAAAPASRSRLARRLLAGSLDRATDLAATLELRGHALGSRPARAPRRRSRHGRAVAAAAVAIAAVTLAAALAGAGGAESYPRVEVSADPATLALAAALPALALSPFALAALGPRARRRRRRPIPARPAHG